MTENGRKPALERALEIAVYAPIGFAVMAKDVVPPLVDQLVARGKTEVEQLGRKAGEQLGQARIVGQFAVSQGGEQLRRGVGTRVEEARGRGERLARTIGLTRDDHEPAPRTTAAPAKKAAATNGDGRQEPQPTSDHLPIPDYDELSASQVVARLAGLSDDDLTAIRDYESARRKRKTILTKIDQLTTTDD